MKKVGVNDITYNQFSKIIIGATVGVGILSLPNDLSKISMQDAWISAFIGGWYPLFITILCVFIANNHPKENIFNLSKKYFGKILGEILGFIFLFQFFVYTVTICSGLSNVLRVHIVYFLNPQKTIGVILLLSAFGCTKGLNPIGRINEIAHYFMIILMLVPLIAFKEGTYLNISPILGAGIGKIMKATKEAGFAYAGVEIIFLIYPFIDDSKKIKSSAFKAIGVVISIYTWFTFTTIYYLAPDIAKKSNWAFMILTESVDVPLISNFRFLFMLLWSMVIFKTVIDNYYAIIFSLNQYIKKISINRLAFMLLPVIIYLSSKYGNESQRRTFTEIIRSPYVYFNITYITTLAIIIYFKRDRNYEK